MKEPNSNWIVPRLWPDGECFILGGGPSLEKIDMSRMAGRRVIAVNNAYQLGDWPVMLYGDCAWWKTMRNSEGLGHKAMLAKWGGLKVHPCKNGCVPAGVHILNRRNRPFGIQRSPDRVAWNLSSGACAINLAVHFGVARIVLLGFDMRRIGDEHNWHREHGQRPAKFDPYPRHLEPFAAIARDLKAMAVECINATPGSAIECFPIRDPEDIF